MHNWGSGVRSQNAQWDRRGIPQGFVSYRSHWGTAEVPLCILRPDPRIYWPIKRETSMNVIARMAPMRKMNPI
jgi:hypothetical protein